MKLQKSDITKIRLYKSGLVKPFGSIKECAGKLCGIQAQAQQFGEISIFNRVKKVTAKDLRCAYKNHEIIKIWGQRMTVHMYNAVDWKIIHQVYGQNFIKKGWADKGNYLENLINKIDKLTLKKQIIKKDITDLIEKTVPHIKNPYRDYSVIVQATLEGIIFGVPQSPQTKYFANRKACIGDKDFAVWQKKQEEALESLLETYFKAYGPATLKDFCHWSGLAKKEIEPALENIKKNLECGSLDCSNQDCYSQDCDRIGSKAYYFMKGDNDLKDYKKLKTVKVKLLGKFDPLLVAFSDKSWIADAKQQKAIWRPAGHVEAIVILNGTLAGTWRCEISGKNVNFNLEVFRTISKEEKEYVYMEAKKISIFLSKSLGKISYIKKGR